MAFELRHSRTLTLNSYDRSYTLVHVAVLIVIAGIVAGVTNQAYDSFASLENQRFYTRLGALENSIFSYQEKLGRWPGDCNRDGVIGYHPARQGRVETGGVSDQSAACDVLGRHNEGMQTPFADLGTLGLLDSDASSLVAGSAFQIGSGALRVEQKEGNANVIVAYDVPADVAQWVDYRVDGDVDGEKGRVRRWDVQDTGTQWPQGQGSDAVALAYYFDRVTP